MAKAARKSRAKNSNPYNGNLTTRSVQSIPISRPQTMQQTFDPGRYIKNDLKWSAICAAIVVILIAISYVLFR